MGGETQETELPELHVRIPWLMDSVFCQEPDFFCSHFSRNLFQFTFLDSGANWILLITCIGKIKKGQGRMTGEIPFKIFAFPPDLVPKLSVSFLRWVPGSVWTWYCLSKAAVLRGSKARARDGHHAHSLPLLLFLYLAFPTPLLYSVSSPSYNLSSFPSFPSLCFIVFHSTFLHFSFPFA